MMVPVVRKFLLKLDSGTIFDHAKSTRQWKANLVVYVLKRFRSSLRESYRPTQANSRQNETCFKAFASPKTALEIDTKEWLFARMQELGVKAEDMQRCIEKGDAFYFRRKCLEHQNLRPVKKLLKQLRVYDTWKNQPA
jgi:hypothetical protein